MIDEAHVTAASVGLTVAGLVKGATGVGYATVALPVLVAIVGLKSAMALIVAPTLAANLGLALTAGHLGTTLRCFAGLYLAMLPGVATGALLLAVIDQDAAVTLLGMCMIGYALFALMTPRMSLSPTAARILKIPAGFLTGLVTGITGSQVLPLVPYMLALNMDKGRTVQAINVGVLVLTSTLGISLLAARTVEPGELADSLLAIVPALAGSMIGAALHKRLDSATLRRLVLGVVGLGGVKMVLG